MTGAVVWLQYSRGWHLIRPLKRRVQLRQPRRQALALSHCRGRAAARGGSGGVRARLGRDLRGFLSDDGAVGLEQLPPPLV